MKPVVRADRSMLPFAALQPQRKDWWSVAETGDWATDTHAGRSYADDFITYASGEDMPGLLGYIVKEMITKGRFGPIEIGFFTQLSRHLTSN